MGLSYGCTFARAFLACNSFGIRLRVYTKKIRLYVKYAYTTLLNERLSPLKIRYDFTADKGNHTDISKFVISSSKFRERYFEWIIILDRKHFETQIQK